MKAFFILGVEPDADDIEIENAYRKLVTQYPPDTCSEKFKLVSHAYQQIKDSDDRLRYLMNLDETSSENKSQSLTDEVLTAIKWDPMVTHLNEKDFYQFLKSN